MKFIFKPIRTLAANLLTFGLLTAGANAAFIITDITGVATDGLYAYTNGSTTDRLGIPLYGNDNFWTISVESPNVLLFDTQLNIGYATAVVNLSGLEANDDWASATISSTGGLPSLVYSGGGTAALNFYNGQTYNVGNKIRISFTAVPEPSSLLLLGLGVAGFTMRRQITR